MEHPDVRRHINELISGLAAEWPMDWFQALVCGKKFSRALSIGCGSGPLERDLLRRRLCESIDAFDGSVYSLYIAKKEADEAGLNGQVRYFAADFNRPCFPRASYDAVFFHQSLHHVGKLEKLLRAVLRALKPGGILYLDEYVGPSRTDWDEEKIGYHRAIYEQLPAA